MEIRILTGLKWQISFPTAVHFKEYYMQVYALSISIVRARFLNELWQEYFLFVLLFYFFPRILYGETLEICNI